MTALLPPRAGAARARTRSRGPTRARLTTVALAGLCLLALAAPSHADEEARAWARMDGMRAPSVPSSHRFHGRFGGFGGFHSPFAMPSGSLSAHLDESGAQLRVEASGLEPDTSYALRANGVDFDDVVADGAGEVVHEVDLLPIALDPRGKLISLADADGDVLAAVLSGPLEPALAVSMERTELAVDPAAAGARARVRFRRTFFGAQHLMVLLQGAPPGDYHATLDGDPIGGLRVGPGGVGRLDLFGRQGWHVPAWLFRHHRLAFLNEDPRDRLLELERDGAVLFAGPVRAQIPGLTADPGPDPGACTPGMTEVAMDGNVGEAFLRVGFDDTCVQHMEVEVSFFRGATYTIEVNGTAVGSLVAGGLLGEGLVHFASDPMADELPLDFPLASGDTVAITYPADDLVLATAVVP